jgi:hypothetical protein
VHNSDLICGRACRGPMNKLDRGWSTHTGTIDLRRDGIRGRYHRLFGLQDSRAMKAVVQSGLRVAVRSTFRVLESRRIRWVCDSGRRVGAPPRLPFAWTRGRISARGYGRDIVPFLTAQGRDLRWLARLRSGVGGMRSLCGFQCGCAVDAVSGTMNVTVRQHIAHPGKA